MNAKSLYSSLESDRHTYLERARDCAKLTIPTLVPPSGHSSSTIYPVPFQGLGARGVNHLAASLLMSLLPPNQPFFRLALDEEAVRALGMEGTVKAEIDKTLSSIERSVMQEIETMALRPAIFEAMKQLIVAGNVLLHLKDRSLKVYQLEKFVIQRDGDGNIQHIVVVETVSRSALPIEVQEQIPDQVPVPGQYRTEDDVDVYTCVHAVGPDKWEAWQEIEGKVIESTKGKYSRENFPWFALRMNRIDGESYGRGYVEEYLGDLKSLEALTQAIVEGSAAAAKVLFLVNPNGFTNAETLARSPNGAIREGLATDVTVLQIQKQGDFSVALQTIAQIRERISYAFLLAESTIRNAERVTAEEVRLTTAAVERQLGGIYSILSQELQLPLVRRLMGIMVKQKRLPKVPDEYVKPMIVTGVDALGRGNDLTKLDTFLIGLQQVLGPEALLQYVNVSEYLNRRAAALGIDTDGLIKSDEDRMAEQQRSMSSAIMDKATSPVAGQIAKALGDGTIPAEALTGVGQGAAQLAQQMRQ
jgi:hypothetical protein